MAKSKGNKTFDVDFKTPLTAPKPGKEVGPAVFNIPLMDPADPMGYVPSGVRGGTIKGDKN